MKKLIAIMRVLAIVLMVASTLLLSRCKKTDDTLNPEGPESFEFLNIQTTLNSFARGCSIDLTRVNIRYCANSPTNFSVDVEWEEGDGFVHQSDLVLLPTSGNTKDDFFYGGGRGYSFIGEKTVKITVKVTVQFTSGTVTRTTSTVVTMQSA